MHRQNIQFLDIEFHKIVNGFSPEMTKEVFPINVKTTLNTKNKKDFDRSFNLKNFYNISKLVLKHVHQVRYCCYYFLIQKFHLRVIIGNFWL